MAAELRKVMQINGFAKHLVENGLLSEEEAKEVEYKAKQDDLSMVNFLIKNKLLDYKTIAFYKIRMLIACLFLSLIKN